MSDEISEHFKGLPMADLIAGPLTAVCESQLKLAAASYEYINKIGFDDDKKTTRLVEFDLNRPAETETGYTTVRTHMQAPLLGLVPVPAFLVEEVNIEFQMEVSAATTETTKSASEGSMQSEAKFRLGWFGSASVNIQGKLSSSRENTRSTNQSAKYQVRVYARQQQQTEGLSRLMDILAECTAALPSAAV